MTQSQVEMFCDELVSLLVTGGKSLSDIKIYIVSEHVIFFS